MVPYSAVQLGAFADSSAAGRMRDSLERAGWNAYVRRATDGGWTLWRVRALPTTAASLARAVAFAHGARAGATVTVVADTGALTGDHRLFRLTGGWRVQWTADGDRLLASAGPAMVADDAEPSSWLALDPASGAVSRELPAPPRVAEVQWTDGPTLDISIPQDLETRVAMPIEGGQVESSNGWIRVLGRIIGPGTALATTRGGRFVVALIPDPDAGEFDAKEMLAVYVVAR